jgi:MFS transporter, Spinster family, sphingosine-1-phosphate transporter
MTAKVSLPWSALFLLTAMNLLNYLDRYVVSSLVEALKASELALTDAQAGLLMTSFLILYVIASPFFGVLGDRGNRPRLMGAGIFVWSLATALGFWAWSFASMLFLRSLIGIGESAYATIAPAYLNDHFPQRLKGRVFSFFYAAIPIGGALGYAVGGIMEKYYGWRSAFLVAGVPGVVLALLVFRMADSRPSQKISMDWAVLGSSIRGFFRNTYYMVTIAGYAAYTFALGALAFWMPAYLERIKGMDRMTATTSFGVVVVGTGFLGTFLGGFLTDRLRSRIKDPELCLSGWATLASVPILFLAFHTDHNLVFWTAVVVAELLIFASTGPINLAIVGAVGPGLQAQAMAFSNLVGHLLGDVPSPALVGAISDQSNLGSAMLIIPVVMGISGVIWIYGQRK